MGLKKYVVLAVLFIVLVYGYVFSLELGDYKITILDISVNLPISSWIILPLVLLFIATLGHILFYGLLGSLKQRAINKDHETMVGYIKSSLLGKTYNKKFKTPAFKSLFNVLKQFELKLKDETFSSTDEELNKIVANIKDIKNGKFVEDKAVKFTEYSDISTDNIINKVNENIDFAQDVLKKSENYNINVIRQAFIKVLDEKSMTTMKKLFKNIKLDKELAFRLFEKDAKNPDFGLSNDEIAKIVKDLDLNKEEYLTLAKIYETELKPDEIIALFEKLSTEIEKALPAYLHVLFEYEMIDKVREIIEATKEDELTAFKALLDLKDAGKHYSLESISYK
jgi:hypothetical protein